MMKLWLKLFFIFCFIYIKKSSKIRLNFNEIFGEEWDKKENEENAIKIEQKKENSEENGIESIDQMRTDQNIIKSDQNIKEEPNDQQKKEILQKFEAIKEKLKQKRKYQGKNRVKIERKIGKLLGQSRDKIYKWKKELNLNKNKIMKKSFYEEKKRQFIERFDEFKHLYGQGKQKKFVKELGISKDTFRKWKKELMPNYNKTPNSTEEKLQKMKQYFEIKEANPKISDEIIAGKLKIAYGTLKMWKQKFSSALKM